MSKLERIIHDDRNGLDYILVGEIYLPLIAVSEEKRDIGFYGSLHRNYLKDYKSGLYSYLTLTGKLWTYLADLNEQCVERRDFLMNQIMQQEGITEELKSRDQMEWVRQANNVRSRVDEIILNELVYDHLLRLLVIFGAFRLVRGFQRGLQQGIDLFVLIERAVAR